MGCCISFVGNVFGVTLPWSPIITVHPTLVREQVELLKDANIADGFLCSSCYLGSK